MKIITKIWLIVALCVIQSSAWALTMQEERKLGEEFFSKIQQNVPIISDPILNAYIDQLTQRLISQSRAPKRKYTFFIVDSTAINAFAGPDGYIGITTGLIQASRNESELASVIAHEIAHVSQRHLSKMIDQNKSDMWKTLGTMLAGVALGVATSNGEIASGLVTAGMASQVEGQLAYSRQFESEADRVAVETLAKANYNTASLEQFFRHMLRLSNQYGIDPPEWLMSHPVPDQRITQARRYSSLYQKKPSQESSEFKLAQARLNVLLSLNLMETQYQYQKDNSLAGQYAYAISLNLNGELQKATEIYQRLLKREPQQQMFIASLGDSYLQQGQNKLAYNLLANNYKKQQNYFPLRLLYSEALLRVNNSKLALTILKNTTVPFIETNNYNRLLANAYANLGQTEEARKLLKRPRI